jgi:ATP-binding cassette subfamily B (MDR/TAP) protein 1
LDQLNVNWLRKHVRLVQQEPILFQGSVFDNIAYGLVGTEWENASREERMTQVREAAQLAYADEFISGLPNGYDTEIGQRGGLLSGGQKQRVAIARAVVSKPKVLLLDEATSALDPHAEEVVQQALDQASKGRTTIVIAHKLATIRKADNIVVMTKGRIIEQGSHAALIAQDGTYARLVKIQNLSVSAEEEAEESTSENKDKDKAEHVCADPADLTKTLTRFETADRARLEAQKDRDSYENHKHLGFVGVIWRLVRETPELKWVYMITLISCVLGGKLPHLTLLMRYQR